MACPSRASHEGTPDLTERIRTGQVSEAVVGKENEMKKPKPGNRFERGDDQPRSSAQLELWCTRRQRSENSYVLAGVNSIEKYANTPRTHIAKSMVSFLDIPVLVPPCTSTSLKIKSSEFCRKAVCPSSQCDTSSKRQSAAARPRVQPYDSSLSRGSYHCTAVTAGGGRENEMTVASVVAVAAAFVSPLLVAPAPAHAADKVCGYSPKVGLERDS